MMFRRSANKEKPEKRYTGSEMHKIVLGYFEEKFNREDIVKDATCRRTMIIDNRQVERDDVCYIYKRIKPGKEEEAISEKIALFVPTCDNDNHDPRDPLSLTRALSAFNRNEDHKDSDVLLMPIAETQKYRFGFKTRRHWVLAEFRPKENKCCIYDPKNALPLYNGPLSRFISPYAVDDILKTCKKELKLKSKPQMRYTGRQRFFSSHRCGPTIVSMIEEKYKPGKQNPFKKAFGRVGRRITAPYRFFTHEGNKIRNRQRGYKDRSNEFLATQLGPSAQPR